MKNYTIIALYMKKKNVDEISQCKKYSERFMCVWDKMRKEGKNKLKE